MINLLTIKEVYIFVGGSGEWNLWCFVELYNVYCSVPCKVLMSLFSAQCEQALWDAFLVSTKEHVWSRCLYFTSDFFPLHSIINVYYNFLKSLMNWVCTSRRMRMFNFSNPICVCENEWLIDYFCLSSNN